MSVSDQIDMYALQSHHSDFCFHRMRLITAYGTDFFLNERCEWTQDSSGYVRYNGMIAWLLLATKLGSCERSAPPVAL